MTKGYDVKKGVRIRRVLVGMASAGVVLALGACSSSSSSSGSAQSAPSSAPATSASAQSTAAGTTATKITSIAWGDAVAADPQYKAMGDSFVKSAQALGIKVYRFDNAANGATSVTNARLMVQEHPDVIIDYSGIASANPEIGSIFAAAKIPCVAINLPIPSCSQFGFSQQQLGTEVGTAAGKAIVASGWTGSDTTLIDAWSPMYGQDVNYSQSYLYSALAQALPQWKQVSGADIPLTTTNVGSHAVFVNGSGDLQTTNTVVKQALQDIPSSQNVIVSVFNHNSALGAQQALIAAGRKNWVIIGSGPSAAEIQSIQTNAHWLMSADFFFTAWPKYALAMAYALHAGTKPPALTESAIQATTKSNVNTYYNSAGLLKSAPPLPAADAYLAPYLAQVGGAVPTS
jgi:ribose transport system substrate-binding protein